MRHLSRWMSWTLTIVMLVTMAVLPGSGLAEADSDSDMIFFDPAAIQYFEISSEDFTSTEEMRALFAFMMSFEFDHLELGYEYDFSNSIYVAINDKDIATVALGLKDGYLILLYSDMVDPCATAYTFVDTTDSFLVEMALEASSKSVWEVPIIDFLAAGQAVSDALAE